MQRSLLPWLADLARLAEKLERKQHDGGANHEQHKQHQRAPVRAGAHGVAWIHAAVDPCRNEAARGPIGPSAPLVLTGVAVGHFLCERSTRPCMHLHAASN